VADVKWIKLVTDVFDDEKILLIEAFPEADSIIVIWFKLLCLAGKQNNSGVFIMSNGIPYTDRMLSTIFRRKEATVKLALDTFHQFGMIDIIENTITIPNWEKHQQLDQLEMTREATRKRVEKHREKQKTLAHGDCNVTVTLPVTVCNGGRVDKNREDKNREDKNNNDEADNVDVDFAKLYNTFETEFGRPLSAMESEQITAWKSEMKTEMIYEALKRAVLSNKKTMQYINGILQNWNNAGHKCLGDVFEADKQREQTKKAGVKHNERSFRGEQEDIYSDEIYEVL